MTNLNERAKKLLAREVAKQPAEIDLLADDVPPLVTEEAALRAIAAALSSPPVEQVRLLLEALTPSAETKAEYIGEFGFDLVERDAQGDEYQRRVTVPWTTIKEIMAAIRKRAESASPLPVGEEQLRKALKRVRRELDNLPIGAVSPELAAAIIQADEALFSLGEQDDAR